MTRLITPFIAIAVTTGMLLPTPVKAQSGFKEIPRIMNSNEVMDTTYGPHGGKLIERRPYQLETLGCPDGIRVFVYDADGELIDLEDIDGVLRTPDDSLGIRLVDFTVQEDPKRKIPYFRSTDPKRKEHLFAPVDYTLSPDGVFTISVKLANLPQEDNQTLIYSLIFGLTRLRGFICRGHPGRVSFAYKDRNLCKKRYQVAVPVLFQCPEHEFSRSDKESKCPLCGSLRVPVIQSAHPHLVTSRKPPVSPLLKGRR